MVEVNSLTCCKFNLSLVNEVQSRRNLSLELMKRTIFEVHLPQLAKPLSQLHHGPFMVLSITSSHWRQYEHTHTEKKHKNEKVLTPKRDLAEEVMKPDSALQNPVDESPPWFFGSVP